MRNPLCILTISFMLLTTAGGRLMAQAEGPQGLAFHIEGLTAEERDAFANDLARDGEFRIAYACVPAGILVLEGATTVIQESDRTRAVGALQHFIGSRSATTETRSRDELEEACMNVRNQ